MLIAQLTDMHITRPGVLAGGIVDTAGMLRRAVSAVLALTTPPDLVVLTGDLTDSGHPDEYVRLRALLAPLRAPVLCIPGNHDDRDALRAAFPSWPPGPFLQFVHDAGPLRIVGLDTVVPGETRGELCATRLAWLDQTLTSSPSRPTLVLLHHPPFDTGIRFMDEVGLITGREAFADIIARHRQVRLLLSGHLHRSIHTIVGGCRALTCPSTAHQIPLDLRSDAPEGFCLEPPGFMLHRWTENGFITHTAVTSPSPGPFPF